MRKFVQEVNYYLDNKIKTVACCCGHGRYPMTIFIKNYYGLYEDLFSGKMVGRKKKIYKKDGKGFYYCPEVCDEV